MTPATDYAILFVQLLELHELIVIGLADAFSPIGYGSLPDSADVGLAGIAEAGGFQGGDDLLDVGHVSRERAGCGRGSRCSAAMRFFGPNVNPQHA